ncbi:MULTISPECIES: YbaY family lipoprotein [unclassified Ruegeria]|uniref:YbaY family lipoprotein n=1 Tax=unclassified Ruegeria TaxID=2625375 RepID=UPI001ADB832F|nr:MULTISPECIES: YbaY family lipoprotein [unclassified Ruegeria]MBO9411203.1 YbaY family lipoprotein [Ruegeria sp. R8_1]MBO9415404.1 YbaY family lipoprotein [Ruegeria sp. R8_2]
MPIPKLGQAIVVGAVALTILGGQSHAGTVTGTATYRERIAVLPDATLFVELQDVSLADAPAVTLASQRYALTNVPADYQLTYDDALIQDGRTYAVRGAIYQGNKLLFTTDTVNPVLTRGAGDTADLLLVKVPSQPAASLDGTNWTAIGINGEVVDAKRPPQITFAQGGAFGGTGGCNRFSGQAEISGDSLNFPDNMAATLMACPPELEEVEDQFLAALQTVTRYAMAGDSLVLLDAAGEPVLKFVRAH